MLNHLYTFFLASLVKKRANRLACAELYRLSDKDLNDIGISRSEIRSRVYGYQG